MLELEVQQTHLYPGARGRILAGVPEDGPVRLIFADLGVAAGVLNGDRLMVAAHRTERGSEIPGKIWVVAWDGGAFRILARG